ncbi:MAG: Fic family protein [Desulfobacterales bacterium]|nr:Fic family protein [Desulfobacterales bacterium]
MVFDPNKPYNGLPLLPPAEDIESRRILKKCIDARAALAELKQAGRLIPEQSVLINTIPLLEAQMSSEIENIVTTTDKLFQYASLDNDKADAAIKETLRYRQALYHGCQSIKKRPVSAAIALEICGQIRKTDVSVRRMPGTVLSNPLTRETIYTPPNGEKVILDKLSNWEHFLNESISIDPLIRMAVMHYQFEAIHPFTDGNGRTGRLLNILFLAQEGLLEIPILYLSKYIIDNRQDYYSNIRAVTERQDWQEWILYMLDAVEQTAGWTNRKIYAIRELLEHTCDYVKKAVPKIYSRELVDIVFTQPYCRIQNVVDANIAKRQTASIYLKKLAEIGVLDERKEGRDRVFVHPKFLNLLKQDDNAYPPYQG